MSNVDYGIVTCELADVGKVTVNKRHKFNIHATFSCVGYKERINDIVSRFFVLYVVIREDLLKIKYVGYLFARRGGLFNGSCKRCVSACRRRCHGSVGSFGISLAVLTGDAE